jgi:RNA polymerase sigma-70 factor (ECF subfamily)
MTKALSQKSPENDVSDIEKGLSDHSLLSRLRGGDHSAAKQLYHRYAHRVRALARKNNARDLTRRLDEDDIVQSVFRVFFRQASKGRYDVPKGEDLWRLLLVLALNKIRAERTYHHAAKRDARLTSGIDALEKAAPTAGRRAGQAAAHLQLVVTDALGRLSSLHRVVIDLRVEGYEVAEIADKIQRSKRTVERLLQEARSHLRDLLPEAS